MGIFSGLDASWLTKTAVGLSCVFLASCGAVEKLTKKGTKSGTGEAYDSSIVAFPNDGKLVIATDLAVAPGFVLDSYSQDLLITKIETNSDFYSYQPEQASKSEFVKCVDEKYKDARLKANKVSIVSSIEADVSECVRLLLTSDQIQLKSVQSKNRNYYYASCEGGDVSAMNGVTWIDDSKVSINCPKLTEWKQSLTDTVLEYEIDGVVVKTSQRTITHLGDGKLGGCTTTTNGTITVLSDDCVKLTKLDKITTTSIDTSRSIPVRKYQWTKLGYKGISRDTSSKDNTWFNSGSISLEMNGWTGVVNYKDSKNAPTFSVTSALTGASAEGTLIPSPPDI